MNQNSVIGTATTETALAKIKRKEAQKLRAGFAVEIRRKHREAFRYASKVKTVMEFAMQSAFECGRLLTQQKQQLGKRGDFEEWCKEFVPEISKTTIWRYRVLFEQVCQYLEAMGGEAVNVSSVKLCELNFPSLRQLYIAFGILPDHEQNGEPKPNRSFLDPLLRVLGSSRFDALKDEQTLDKLSRDELFMLNRSLEPFLAIKSRIETRLAGPD